MKSDCYANRQLLSPLAEPRHAPIPDDYPYNKPLQAPPGEYIHPQTEPILPEVFLKDNDNYNTTIYDIGDGIAVSEKKTRGGV